MSDTDTRMVRAAYTAETVTVYPTNQQPSEIRDAPAVTRGWRSDTAGQEEDDDG